MKLQTLIAVFAGLLIAQVSFAQEVGTTTDTTTVPTPVDVKPEAVMPTENTAQTEATLEAQKKSLEAQEKAQKAQEKLAKEQAKAQKEQEKLAKEQAKAQKEQEKLAKEQAKKQERLSKANQEVSKLEAKIAKAQTALAKEQNNLTIKKAKGKLSPQDEAKLNGEILDRKQDINDLNFKLLKAKEKVNKYSI